MAIKDLVDKFYFEFYIEPLLNEALTLLDRTKTIDATSLRWILHRCYPFLTEADLTKQSEGVMLAMYDAGFETWNSEESTANESLEFPIADFMEFYWEAYLAEPGIVRTELENLERAITHPRKNPFKIVISRQHYRFECFQAWKCFAKFPNETLRQIIEFLEGKEKNLLSDF